MSSHPAGSSEEDNPVILRPCSVEVVRRLAHLLLSRSGHTKEIKTLEEFGDREYGKTYSSYLVTDMSGARFVLKRIMYPTELYAYRSVFVPSDPVPKLLDCEEDDRDGSWILLEHCGTRDLRGSTVDEHLRAAVRLADFHAQHWNTCSATYPRLSSTHYGRQSRAESLEALAGESSDHDLKWASQAYRLISSLLEECPTTVTHGDLLSMNILRDRTKVTLIDWSEIAIGGFCEDLGRWLGDLRGATGPRWVPNDWVPAILEAYFARVTEHLGPGWMTLRGFHNQYAFGKCLNHLEIVASHLVRGWQRGDWYEANLAAAKTDLARIQ